MRFQFSVDWLDGSNTASGKTAPYAGLRMRSRMYREKLIDRDDVWLAAMISQSGCCPSIHGAKWREPISDFPERGGHISSRRGSSPRST